MYRWPLKRNRSVDLAGFRAHPNFSITSFAATRVRIVGPVDVADDWRHYLPPLFWVLGLQHGEEHRCFHTYTQQRPPQLNSRETPKLTILFGDILLDGLSVCLRHGPALDDHA